jgi:hypothetical protein
MKVEHIEAREAFVRLDVDELRIVKQALNEVCHGLDIPEFATRMGAELGKVEQLLRQIGRLIDEMEHQSPQL